MIPARNCERSIANVLRQVHKAGIQQSVVVVNGSIDKTANAARDTIDALGLHAWVCDLADPLGPDVPRALGVLYALRLRPTDLWDSCVIVDGDWEGSFGNNLALYIRTASVRGLDVAWPGEATRRIDDEGETAGAISRRQMQSDITIWNEALKSIAPSLKGACPSRAPLWLSRRICATISPLLLCHPGLWMAQCVLVSQSPKDPRISLGVIDFDARWLGNPTRSRGHQELMQDTLIGDAVEGVAALTGQRQTREWNGRVRIGYHADRDIEFLRQWSASIQPCFV